MLIPLPDLDDRRWTDLVEESRALIPVFAREWTDHNASDPGVTLIEYFAWLTEMDVYRVNRIAEATRRKFLGLVGVQPEPSMPASTVLAFELAQTALGLELPAGTEFQGQDPFGASTRFRTLHPLNVVAGDLRAVYRVAAGDVHDLTASMARGEGIAPFGMDPRRDAAFYLGFARPLPLDVEATLFVALGGSRVDLGERASLIAEARPSAACVPLPPACDAETPGDPAATAQAAPVADAEPAPLEHHSVRLAWEFRTQGGRWQSLDPDNRQVTDETRSMTLTGRVVLRPPGRMGRGGEEGMDASLYYVRCRFDAGAYEAPPRVDNIALNAVAAEQAVAPAIGAPRRTIDPRGSGLVADRLGTGSGLPRQVLTTSERQVIEDTFVLHTIEDHQPRAWHRRGDLDASSRSDRHYLLYAASGRIVFGDGEHGRTVAHGVPIVATYRVTRAEAGNLAANKVTALAPSDHNRAALAFDGAAGALARTTNVTPAIGGAAAETLARAEGRAIELMEHGTSAVTLADFERLALATPGTRVARASAIAGLHPAFPCVTASGMVTVLVIPSLPADRPMPSAPLLRAVQAYLSRRRLLGTRVQVIAPTYVEVAVQARITVRPGLNRATVEERVVTALRRFFSPLEGGPDGTGWPFGRDVYRAEVLHELDQVEGVVRTDSLELLAGDCSPDCSNVCVGPTGLVYSGQHRVRAR